MRSCFVPGCDKRSKNLSRRPMFFAPKDDALFRKWSAVLHSTRPFKRSDRICYLHFRQIDIQSSFEHIINGQKFQIERDRWRLKENAVPTLKLNANGESVLNPRRNVRNSRGKCKTSVPVTTQADHIDLNEIPNKTAAKEIIPLSTKDVGESEKISTVLCHSDKSTDFSHLYDEALHVQLPNSLWGVHRCTEKKFILYTFIDASKVSVSKMLRLDCDGTVSIYVNGQLSKSLNHNVANGLTKETMSKLLVELDALSASDSS